MPNQNKINAATPVTVPNGGTGVNTFTTPYGVLCGGTTATNNLQNAGAGTSAQVFVSNGSSTLPSFKDASQAGASMKLIQTQTASSSATIDFTTGVTSTYDAFMVYISSYTPATNTTTLRMLVSTNGGSSYQTANYQSGVEQRAYNIAAWQNFSTAVAYFYVLNSVNNTGKHGSYFHIIDGTNGNAMKIFGQGIFNSNGTTTYTQNIGRHTATNINALRFIPTSGAITTGTFSLYGILK